MNRLRSVWLVCTTDAGVLHNLHRFCASFIINSCSGDVLRAQRWCEFHLNFGGTCGQIESRNSALKQTSHMQWCWGLNSYLQNHQGLRPTCLQYFSKLVQWSSLWLKTQDCFNRHVSIDLLTSATTKKTAPPSKAPDVERQSSWSARSPFEDTEERMNSKGNERFTEHVVKHAVKHCKHDELFSWHTHTHTCCPKIKWH